MSFGWLVCDLCSTLAVCTISVQNMIMTEYCIFVFRFCCVFSLLLLGDVVLMRNAQPIKSSKMLGKLSFCCITHVYVVWISIAVNLICSSGDLVFTFEQIITKHVLIALYHVAFDCICCLSVEHGVLHQINFRKWKLRLAFSTAETARRKW